MFATALTDLPTVIADGDLWSAAPATTPKPSRTPSTSTSRRPGNVGRVVAHITCGGSTSG
jgi:hypothetical protein